MVLLTLVDDLKLLEIELAPATSLFGLSLGDVEPFPMSECFGAGHLFVYYGLPFFILGLLLFLSLKMLQANIVDSRVP